MEAMHELEQVAAPVTKMSTVLLKQARTQRVKFRVQVPQSIKVANRVRDALNSLVESGQTELGDLNLRDKDLTLVRLNGAVLDEANFRFATLSYSDVSGASFKAAHLGSAKMSHVLADHASFAGACLGYACLSGSSLKDANCTGADFRDADLRSVQATGANFRFANFAGADLRCAQFEHADLRGIVLEGTTLTTVQMTGAIIGRDESEELHLVGERPYLAIGPIGSRADTLHVFVTHQGVYLRTGCFFGSVDEFKAALEEAHGDYYNRHHREYQAALVLARTHGEAWGQY